MAGDILKDATRSKGDCAGVFEYDGDVGYFYLYETPPDRDSKVTGAIHVLTGASDFDESDVEIRWNADETVVGLLIRQRLWAAFDSTSERAHGGDYRPNVDPILPVTIASCFQTQ